MIFFSTKSYCWLPIFFHDLHLIFQFYHFVRMNSCGINFLNFTHMESYITNASTLIDVKHMTKH